MDFAGAHAAFMAFHTSRRRGEALRRLTEGHGHAERLFLERVWWPVYGHFRHLHPEYEVADFEGGHRYLDFAYIRGDLKLAIEIDGYGPHVAKQSRWQFARQLNRQNQLVIDGWAVLRFAYDEVQEQPRRCQQTLQQFMGRWFDEGDLGDLTFLERAIVRLAQQSHGVLTPQEVRRHLNTGRDMTYKLLRDLVSKNWLEPAGGNQRIRSYRLKPTRVV